MCWRLYSHRIHSLLMDCHVRLPLKSKTDLGKVLKICLFMILQLIHQLTCLQFKYIFCNAFRKHSGAFDGWKDVGSNSWCDIMEAALEVIIILIA